MAIDNADKLTRLGGNIIACMAQNRVIGKDNDLPWHIPQDLQFFKQQTSGATVIMGRNTYESVGFPLPKRQNIVVSKSLTESPHAQVQIAPSLRDAVSMAQNQVYYCGGNGIYREALDHADHLYLTELDAMIEGDTKFPEFDQSLFDRTIIDEIPATDQHPGGVIVRYDRKSESS